MEAFAELFASNPDSYLDFLSSSGVILGLFWGLIFGLTCVVSVFLCIFIDEWFKDRKAKKSGKPTTEERLTLLEDKIDCIADIVISTSPEVK